METVVLVLCWLGVLQGLFLGLYSLSSEPRHKSHLSLSHTFSMEFNQRFTNFTNLQGIEASKKILRDPEKEYLSIEGIAFECGFNSLSSFNVLQKKYWNNALRI